MRSPSARCLANRVALYRFLPAQDEDAGLSSSLYGAPFATNVPCSVQPAPPDRLLDPTLARVTESTRYHVMFRTNYSLNADDKIAWVDEAGATRELFVRGQADQAGRGAAFIAICEERL